MLRWRTTSENILELARTFTTKAELVLHYDLVSLLPCNQTNFGLILRIGQRDSALRALLYGHVMDELGRNSRVVSEFVTQLWFEMQSFSHLSSCHKYGASRLTDLAHLICRTVLLVVKPAQRAVFV